MKNKHKLTTKKKLKVIRLKNSGYYCRYQGEFSPPSKKSLSSRAIAIAVLLVMLFSNAQLIGLVQKSEAASIAWDGGGADANWGTDTNWVGDVEPGTGDLAVFDATSCAANCNPTVNVSISVLGISMTVAHTITQTNGTTITIGSSGYTQSAGTFTGGDSTSHMNFNDSSFTLSAGSFTEPGGNMNIDRNFTISGSPTFTHNSGTVIFDDDGATDDSTIDCGSITLNKVTLTKNSNGDMIISSGCTVPLGASPTSAFNFFATFTNNGTITVASGTWTTTGIANLTNNGTITHSGTGWVTNVGLVMGSSGVVNYPSGTTMSVGGNLDVSPVGSTFPSGLTVTFTDSDANDDTTLTCGSVTFTQVIITKDSGGSMIISSGCTVPLGASPTSAFGSAAWAPVFTNNGTITVASGAWTISGEGGSLTNNGTITHSGSGWVFSRGAFTNGSSATVTYSGTTMSLGESLNVASGTFPSGLTVTFTDGAGDDDTTLTCGSVTFTQIILTKDSGGDFIVSSGCTVPLGASPTSALGDLGTYTNNGTITIASGVWTITSSSNTTPHTFTNNGTITHSGTGWVTEGGFTNGSAGVVSSPGSTLTSMSVGGNLDVSLGTFPSSLTVTFTDTGGFDNSTITCGSVTFTQVIITKDSGGDMTISSGCTAPMGASPTSAFSSSGASFTNNGTITVASGTWIITDTASTPHTFTNNGTITHSGSGWTTGGGFVNGSAGVVTYSGSTMTVNATFNVSVGTFPSGLTLTLGDDPSGSSWADHSVLTCGSVTFTKVIITKNSGGAATSGGSLTIGSDCTIPLGASPTTVSNAPATWVNNGTITVDSGTWTHTDTQSNGPNKLTNNGTITHNGDGWNWGNGLANGASGVVTYSNGTTASFSGSLDVSLGTFPSGKIVTFIDANSADDTTLTCGSVTFGGLTINKDGPSTAGDMILGGSCTDTGDLTFTAGTLSNPASAYTLIVQGDSAFNSSGTFGGANLTLSLEGSATSTVSKTAGTFGSIFNVNKSGAGLAQLSTTFAIATQTCTTILGVFDINGQTFTCGSTFTIQDGGTLKLIGSETPTVPTLNSGSTVFYKGDGDGLADSYSIKNYSYHHLTVGMTDSNDTLDATGVTPLTIPGNFTHSGGVFSAPATLNAAGNFTHSGGTFTHNSGTVILNGGDQTVSGNTTFNNLTKNITSPARTLTLGAGETQTIVGTMDLQGTSGNLLSLRSSTPGTQAKIDPQGTRTIEYLDVKDNYNINATVIDITGFNITDSGNNTGWGFPVAGGGGSDGGSSGGGGTSHPFPPPDGGFQVVINNNNTLTTNRNATLTLSGGSAINMVISNSPDFTGASQIAYQTTLAWDLCAGLPSCFSNTYSVYAIFYNQTGFSSPAVQDSIQYLESSVIAPPEPTPSPTPAPPEPGQCVQYQNTKFVPPTALFARNLNPNSKGGDVRVLQVFLNQNGFPLAQNGPGSLGFETTTFGPLTQNALRDFQKTFLAFIGKSHVRGSLDAPTRNFLNQLYNLPRVACQSPPPLPPPPVPPVNRSPFGFLDEITKEGLVRGWAIDLDQETSSILVHLFFDSPADSSQTPFTISANLSRPDVNQIAGFTGNHGFAFPVPDSFKQGNSHTVYTYAIDGQDSSGLHNQELFNSPLSFVFGQVAPEPTTTPPIIPPITEPPAVPPITPPIEPIPAPTPPLDGGDITPQAESGAEIGLIGDLQNLLGEIGSQTSQLGQSVINGARTAFQSLTFAGAGVGYGLAKASQTVKSLLASTRTSKIAAAVGSIGIAPMVVVLQYSLSQGGLVSKITSLSDLWLKLVSLVQGFLTSIGLRKRRRRWGTVYDSVTKQPLDPAIVELVDAKTGKVIEQSITDLAGRFGFLVHLGEFVLSSRKTHYVFPSKIITSTTDGIYADVYRGSILTIQNTIDVLSPNIPMDAMAFDWNQMDKQRLIKFHPKIEIFLAKLLSFLFWLGFGFVILTFLAHPTILNSIFIAIYLLLAFLRKLIPHLRLWGKISSSEIPTKELLLELNPINIPQITLGKALTNKDGRFFLKAPPGQYILRIRQTSDPKMQVLKEKEITIGKEGVLNSDISLE